MTADDLPWFVWRVYALPAAGEGSGQSTLAVNCSTTHSASRRSEPAPDRNAVIEECARKADIWAETKPVSGAQAQAIATIISDTASMISKDIRALKSTTNPNTERKVMPDQPTTTGNNKTSPHPHLSANAADGAKPFFNWMAELDRFGTIDKALRLEIEHKVCRLLAGPQLPDGWVMVPREPTLEMLKVGYDAIKLFTNNETNIGQFRIYEAMLAAAPKPQVPGGE